MRPNNKQLTKRLDQDLVVAGLVDRDDNLWLCREVKREFVMHQVTFDNDKGGDLTYDLWYSRATLGSETKICKERKQLLDIGALFIP